MSESASEHGTLGLKSKTFNFCRKELDYTLKFTPDPYRMLVQQQVCSLISVTSLLDAYSRTSHWVATSVCEKMRSNKPVKISRSKLLRSDVPWLKLSILRFRKPRNQYVGRLCMHICVHVCACVCGFLYGSKCVCFPLRSHRTSKRNCRRSGGCNT